MNLLEEFAGSLHVDDGMVPPTLLQAPASMCIPGYGIDSSHAPSHDSAQSPVPIIARRQRFPQTSDDVIEIHDSGSDTDFESGPIIISDDEDIKPIMLDIKPVILDDIKPVLPLVAPVLPRSPIHRHHGGIPSLPKAASRSLPSSNIAHTTVVKSFKTNASSNTTPKPPKPLELVQQLVSSFTPEAQAQRTLVRSLESSRTALKTEVRQYRSRLEDSQVVALEAKQRADILQLENDRLRQLLNQKNQTFDPSVFSHLIKSLIVHAPLPSSAAVAPADLQTSESITPANHIQDTEMAQVATMLPSSPEPVSVTGSVQVPVSPGLFHTPPLELLPMNNDPSSISDSSSLSMTSADIPFNDMPVAGPGPQTLANRSNRLLELAFAAEKLEHMDRSEDSSL